MDYDKVVEEIGQVPRFGAKASLSNLSGYLSVLGHPENSLRVIHVAGTNGKGSVCAYLESVLRHAGFKTALFTSPHLLDLRERFRIDFEMAKREDVVKAYLQVRDVMDRREELGLSFLTYFEILFLMSLLIFQKEKPDFCIMETGLGGRLDATVLTKPILCVITSISLDHTGILGDSIEEIAAEKAGIVRNHVPIVAINEKNGAENVIQNVAMDRESPCILLSTDDILILKKNNKGIDFSIDSRYYKKSHLRLPTFADYQVMNGALAALSAHILGEQTGDSFIDSHIEEGIFAMQWAGRMEAVSDGVYVDGAHNPGAAASIANTIRESGGQWSLLFAVCEDKDYKSMIESLSDICWNQVYLTRTRGVRGALVKDIARIFREESITEVHLYETVAEAFEAAMSHKVSGENLLCAGSLYLVGEVKKLMNRK